MIRSTITTLAMLCFCAGTTLAQSEAAKPDAKPDAKPETKADAKPAPAPIEAPLAHVEVMGTGPIPVVLIPGLMCDWTVWKTFMTRNTATYTMYAVTLPGFGKSDAPPLVKGTNPSSTVWLDNAERAVVKLIADKKLDKPLLVGHSMGGHIAIRLAGKHSDKLRGVVALDGFPAFPIGPTDLTLKDRAAAIDGQYAAGMDAVTDEAWASQVKAGLKAWVKNEERSKQLGESCSLVPRTTAMRYFLELLASDARADLTNAACPVLLVAAIPDPGAGNGPTGQLRAAWEAQSKLAPKGSLVFFEDTRHFVMDDAPAELDAAIAAIVAGKPAEGKKAPPGNEPVKAVPVEDRPAEKPAAATPVETPKK